MSSKNLHKWGEIITYFGKNLKYLCENKINQNQLSIKLGITRQAVHDLIIEKTNPSFTTLIKIKEIFNINLDDLIFKDLSKNWYTYMIYKSKGVYHEH